MLLRNCLGINIRQPLKDVMGIVFFGVLAGNDDWTDFAVDEKETLQK